MSEREGKRREIESEREKRYKGREITEVSKREGKRA